MCRNIRTLFNFQLPATDAEIHDAALQFVRKLSGFQKPSKANAAEFERAVEEVAAAARVLITSLVTLGALAAFDLHLRNDMSTQGIVSLEVCAYITWLVVAWVDRGMAGKQQAGRVRTGWA